MELVKLHTQQALQPASAVRAPARSSEALRADGESQRRDLMQSLAGSSEAAVTPPQRMEVRMQVEEDLNRVVARVVDSDTGEVIREVPPEELLDLAKRLQALIGSLFDEHV